MLTIICGEDSVASRNYFNQLVKEYESKGRGSTPIVGADLTPSFLEQSHTVSLFGASQIYTLENLNKYINRISKDMIELLGSIDKSKNLTLIVWENGRAAYELKYKKVGTVKEFKPQESIFKLLDLLYPTNIQSFIKEFHTLLQKEDEMFIYVMMRRHVRKLLMAKADASIPGVQSWQLGKIKAQASRWKMPLLESFYDALLRIELQTKSGKNVIGIAKSIDITACYYMS